MIVREEEARREGALRAAQQNLAAMLRLVWHEWGWGDLIWAEHLDVACLVYEQWVRGMLVDDPEQLGLPIQVAAHLPPGTTKTTIFGRAGPLFAQMLAGGRLRLLHGSHTLEGNLDKAEEERMVIGRSRTFLDLVDASPTPWRWGKNADNEQSIVVLENSKPKTRGSIALTSWFGGAATSRHFNGHYLDDLCKARDVFSDKARAAWRRMIDELASRFAQPRRHVFLSMQRLAWNDPVADFMEEYPDALRLVLPRVFEKGRTDYPEQLDLGVPSEFVQAAFAGDRLQRPYRERLERAGFWLESVPLQLGGGRVEHQPRLRWRDWRRDGEYLDPQRFGRKEEKRHRRNLRRWLAEQQQRPSKGEGVALLPASAWKLWSATPPSKPAEILVTLDPQGADPSKRANPDRTALLVGARWSGSLFVLERINGVHTSSQVNAVLWTMGRRWAPHRILVEHSAAGEDIVTHLRGEGLPLLLVKASGSTPVRVHGISATVIAGNVLLPADDAARPTFLRADEPWPGRTFDYLEVPTRLRPREGVQEGLPMPVALAPAAWRPEFVEEIASIPGGPFDDDGDAVAYMIRDVQERLGERVRRATPAAGGSRPPPKTAAERHGVVGRRAAGRLKWPR